MVEKTKIEYKIYNEQQEFLCEVLIYFKPKQTLRIFKNEIEINYHMSEEEIKNKLEKQRMNDEIITKEIKNLIKIENLLID